MNSLTCIILIGQGKSLEETKKEVGMVIESVDNIEVAYEPNETMQREYCCKNPDTNARYRQLQRNIIAYLKNNED